MNIKTTIAIFLLMFVMVTAILAANGSPYETQANRNFEVPTGAKATVNTDSIISALLPLINSDSVESYIQHLQGFGTRFCLAPNHKDVALWVKSKLQSFGYSNVVLDSFQLSVEWPVSSGITVTSWQYNVIADLTGTASPNVHYIVGGHYDSAIQSGDPLTGAPGADDNASGTAGTLEIARIMKAQNFQSPSTIRFVLFAAEELGLHGSINYVTNALQTQEIIPMMVNMDMIGNEPDASGWNLQLQAYVGSEWVRDAAIEISSTYTSLNSLVIMNQDYVGSDSDPFFLTGFPTVFLQEDHFSSVYHTLLDRDTVLNFPYAAEVTKVACGMLINAVNTPSTVNFTIFNPGDGESLEPRWKPNPEGDIVGYNVYIGTSSMTYDTSYFTTDTLFHIAGLETDTLYYIAVTAENNGGIEGPSHELTDAPAMVSMDQGVLIVDDSEGGYYNPPDSVIDRYYRGLCSGFEISEYDALANGAPDLSDMGKYSSIIWHNNKPNGVNKLGLSLPEIVQYLQLGGNILFTEFQPTKLFTGNPAFPAHLRPGMFLFDYAGIDSSNYVTSSAFIRAQPLSSDFPLLEIDTLKTLPVSHHHVSYTDALYPHNPAEAIYSFGTNYDSTIQQGMMKGRPVGIAHEGNGYNIVILSFPLFYIDSAQAQVFAQYVLEDIFSEVPIGISEESSKNAGFRAFPNPASSSISVELQSGQPTPKAMEIIDLSGRIVLSFNSYNKTINVSSVENGLYFLRLRWNDAMEQIPVMIMR